MGKYAEPPSNDQTSHTASGYHHTYFKTAGINLGTLMQWPSDSDLEDASDMAYQDATELLQVLGVDIRRLPSLLAPISVQNAPIRATATAPPLEDVVSNSATDDASVDTNSATIANMLRVLSLSPSQPSATEDRVDACTMAVVAEHIDGTHLM